METLTKTDQLTSKFQFVRRRTEVICSNLEVEDTVIQPVEFVSPPKWHLAHTTWFFEEFVLTKYNPDYKVFNPEYSYYFNSYYNNVGSRVLRPNRGLMTRPKLQDVLDYRLYVTEQLSDFLASEDLSDEQKEVIEIGIQHEQQHQELLHYDIKYIFGHQPAFPTLENAPSLKDELKTEKFLSFEEGVYEIGHQGDDFCFDNELGRHKVYLHDFVISNRLVTNSEYIEFIEAGGYSNFNLWHADGWEFINSNALNAPMYWHQFNGQWHHYTLSGFQTVNPNAPVSHVSFYEASAYANLKGLRLPTEFEWEVASSKLNYGQLWEWTNSAYLPYPNFKTADGALGEYNGKFMVNTMVLRGASIATSVNHSRPTYRNFFAPNDRWQFAGIRLAK
ncbi:ergothioneine biosynthesis protein EgtB [Winogradskyella maritima]|uniref:Ergothioneine biosynthesis protein EgtB n=1 Tax=Winogradskyella maritima TaxID=1517766 RepID=A0ABV8AIX1_9FLAO|nr:ergothioneine biosynthesis protein EgtB [Winogradskyella maritima]